MPETTEGLPAPPVLWAQRKSVVFIKIALEDTKNPVIKLEKDKLYFKGTGGQEKTDHEVTLDFLHDIKPEDSKHVVRDRAIEFVLLKAVEGPFWTRLLKENKKYHWLKVDFNKWKDEDDSEDEVGGGQDIEEMMRQMGGLGGNAGTPDLDDLDGEADSDDEGEEKQKLPDLE